MALPPGDEITNPHAYCRDLHCRHTNWGGRGRLHLRQTDCPPSKHQPKETTMATKLINAVDRTIVQARIDELEAQLAAERKRLAKPAEPFPLGSVIRFQKYNSGYSFAAIKAYEFPTGEGVWYITQDGSRTSKQGHEPKGWDALLDWIGERNWAGIEVLG